MREVRMTFGEHLEELRRRIFYALLYVVVGVVLALVFEKQLMDITLQPHQRAFRKAQKTKLAERLNNQIKKLDEKKVFIAPGTTGSRFTVRDWQVFFKGEVQRKNVIAELAEPFDNFAGEFDALLPSIPPAEHAMFEEAYRRQGALLAARLAKRFATIDEFEPIPGIPRRFKKYEDNLRAVVAPPEKKNDLLLGGWGGSLQDEIDRFAEFNQFLNARRKTVIASSVTIEELREKATAEGDAGDLAIEVYLLDALLGFDEIMTDMHKSEEARIMVISYLEQFYTHLKVALIFGLLFTFPFVLNEGWKFVGAGLYKNEQRYVKMFLPFSLGLFAVGAFFGYTILIPVALTFLAQWGGADIQMAFTLGDYIGLFFTLTLVLGLVFQTPLVMVFLNRIGMVSVQGFGRARRMAILVGFVVSAFLTPPDPFSLLLMAGPLVLLYEVGILVCRLLNFRRKKEVPE